MEEMNNKKKPLPANPFDIMKHALAGTLDEYRAKYKITLTPAKNALDQILMLNPKAKVDDLKALVAELEANGGTSPRGKTPAKIGDERIYNIQNYNETKKAPRPAIMVLPLAMYDDAANEGARAKVKFEKDKIIVTFV